MTWGLVAAGVGTVVGGIIQGNAASSAADAQASAANQAGQIQQQEFNTVNNQYAPQRNLGYGADQLLAQMFGISNPVAPPPSYAGGAHGMYAQMTGNVPMINSSGTASGWLPTPDGGVSRQLTSTEGGAGGAFGAMPGRTANTSVTGGVANSAGNGPGSLSGGPNYSAFYNSPGFQFSQQQGSNAINRAASARGNLYSTNTLQELGTYNTGIASQHYNDYISQLMQMAGLGNSAISGTTQAGLQTSANQSSAALSGGNANASGILGQAGAFSGAINAVPWQKIFSGSGNGYVAPSPENGLQTPTSGLDTGGVDLGNGY